MVSSYYSIFGLVLPASLSSALSQDGSLSLGLSPVPGPGLHAVGTSSHLISRFPVREVISIK